ncbi:MAG: division/cell wall cluster transcriptional repressor MraZ [Acidimicrobiales bacterium]
MSGFVGRYEHSLDVKGRVILPAKFRDEFVVRGGYLAPNTEGCLALWTLGEFERQMAARQERASEGQAERNLARLWASSAEQVVVDKQGRMAIPARLRGYARLESGVFVIGAIDRIELWAPEIWEERVQPSEQLLLEGSGG